jgi:hypothetical protein
MTMTALMTHWQDAVTFVILVAAAGYLGFRSLRRARAGYTGGACAACPANAKNQQAGEGAPATVSAPPCGRRGIPPPS